MATITTTEYLDSGTARTAGENWTINGGNLIIRTDTRWHAGSPASMTGVLGTLSFSSSYGGAFTIDGTKVRWIAYTDGSGTVPAIGTTLTQGAVSGYILAFYANLTSAPTAIGGAVPATGFIKFREVTGGTYSAGAVTASSASVTLSGADVTGWIEVVCDQIKQHSLVEIGDGVNITGEWFSLGTTSGSPNQVVSFPLNGGGTNTYITGIQIETAPGSDIYEWYPAMDTTYSSAFTATTLGTDARAKVVYFPIDGTVIIGSNGTTNIGFTPAAGCKIRMPNVLLRQCTSAARATNVRPNSVSSRPKFTGGGSGGKISISKCQSDWEIAPYNLTAFTLVDAALEGQHSLGICQKPLTYTNVLFGNTANANNGAIIFNAGTRNLTFTNCVIISTLNNTPSSISSSKNITFNNCTIMQCFNRSNGSVTVSISSSSDIVFNNLKIMGGNVNISSCTRISFNNTDYCDRQVGATTSSGGVHLFNVTSSNNVTIDGVSFGLYNTIAACHPYNSILSTGYCTGNIVLQNIGTYNNRANFGGNSTLYPNFIWQSTGPDTGVKIKRIYISGTRSATSYPLFNIADFQTDDCAVEDVFTNQSVTGATGISGSNIILRNVGIQYNNLTITGAQGSVWLSVFPSSTVGRIYWRAHPPGDYSSYSTLTVANAASGYSGAGQILLKNVGDNVISECPWSFKSHTSFANSAISITGTNTANMTYQYQIDTGTGYSGTWKTLNGANLSAEVISQTGFKLKIKIQCTVANISNAVTGFYILTNSSAAAQTDNLYPLSVSTLGFTNLVPGSEVRVYAGTDPATSVEIGGTEATSGSTFSFYHSNAGQDGVIAIFALGYQPIYLPYTFKSTDDSILIQQVIDRNYVNPV